MSKRKSDNCIRINQEIYILRAFYDLSMLLLAMRDKDLM